ncbi:hypothetical protein ACNKHU_00110 [Shigella flexneri]
MQRTISLVMLPSSRAGVGGGGLAAAQTQRYFWDVFGDIFGGGRRRRHPARGADLPITWSSPSKKL